MRKIVTILALCLFPLTGSATEAINLRDAQLAADQSLPHGLTLLADNYILEFPNHPEPPVSNQSSSAASQQTFHVKVPNPSSFESWWSEQYAEQLKSMGWAGFDMPEMHILTRQKDECSERMIVLALGPNSRNSPLLKGSAIPEMDFHAVVFNYSATGTCETD